MSEEQRDVLADALPEQLAATNAKIAELEAQVRVMRGIIVQAMLQRDKEPADTGYMAGKSAVWSTSSTSTTNTSPFGFPQPSPQYVAQKEWLQKQLENSLAVPGSALIKFTEPQA